MSVRLIQRPERWSVPFSDDMNDQTVGELLQISPFRDLDEAGFRGKVTPSGILQNDCRLIEYEPGEIVVRQGDWGNSAFFVVDGQLKADLETDAESSESILGKRKHRRKNFLKLLAQLWTNASENEVRDVSKYQDARGVKKRGAGKQTRIYLPDLGTVLDDCRTATINAGQFFGELSALGRTPRAATVVAARRSRLLELRWQGLRDLMRGDNNIKAHIDKVFRERALGWFLANTPIFRHLEDDELTQLVEAAQFETYGQYDWAASFKRLASQGRTEQNLENEPLIAKQGDHPNGVMIVRSGLARLTQQFESSQQTIGYLGAGQVFGMDEIAEGWKQNQPGSLRYSLRAIGITTVVIIPTRLVEDLILSKKRGAGFDSSARHFQRINTSFVEFLVDKRFVNGTASMLIDMDRCTRCDDCVRACASTHNNNPRFLRNGPIQNNVMIAGACMHCTDPVCMIECPTGAIHRDHTDGSVIINDQTCIGCSACANNCPYGAIRMVEIRDKNGQFIRDQETHLPIVKATKCDLCSDQLGGPACQRACPHGALIRMDMSDVKSLADWLGD